MFVPLETEKVLNLEMFSTFSSAKPRISNLSVKEYALPVHPFPNFLCLNTKRTSLNTVCSLLLFSVSSRK